MKDGFIKVAAAAPSLHLADCSYNAARIGYDSAVQSYQDQKAILDKQIAMAQDNVKNTKALLEIGAASQLELDQAELNYQSAVAGRNSGLAQLEAAIQNAKSGLEQLDLVLDDVDYDGNVVLTEGLVLQDAAIWKTLIGKDIETGSHGYELYFEENDMDAFLEKLEKYPEELQYAHPLMEHSWGQRVVRLYDPDLHLIEVGESMDFVARRFLKQGMRVEEVARKTQMALARVEELAGENI